MKVKHDKMRVVCQAKIGYIVLYGVSALRDERIDKDPKLCYKYLNYNVFISHYTDNAFPFSYFPA